MSNLQSLLRTTTEETAEKVDWTSAWAEKYPVLARYQDEVDVEKYAAELRELLSSLRETYGYSERDAMLVLKDILAHEYLDKGKNGRRHKK
ncbi:MAG: hypothetical protein MJ137_02620 [Clostridia bacterium]|nr:hypothetical protein [Clostridia bacterium]